MKKIIFLIVIFALVSCQLKSKRHSQEDSSYGIRKGTKVEYALKQNEILMNVTWMDGRLWVLTKDTTTGFCYLRKDAESSRRNTEIEFK